ncbi:hypothetical protein SVIOM342S_08238 [Streptomyces violaceorubidus]
MTPEAAADRIKTEGDPWPDGGDLAELRGYPVTQVSDSSLSACPRDEAVQVGSGGLGAEPPARPAPRQVPYAGTCTFSTLLATNRSRSRSAARLRNRRICVSPSAWSTNTDENATP